MVSPYNLNVVVKPGIEQTLKMRKKKMNKTKRLKLKFKECIIKHKEGVAVYATIILKDENSGKIYSFEASCFEFYLKEQNHYKDVSFIQKIKSS